MMRRRFVWMTVLLLLTAAPATAQNIRLTQITFLPGGQVLKVDAGSAALAKGSLVCGTAANTVTFLAVGTNSKVLTANSGETCGVSWETVGAGGGGPGDFSTSTTSSADGEMVVFDGTLGKTGKRSLFILAGPASTAKTYTFPNTDSTVVTTDASQSLTNKTLDAEGTGNAITIPFIYQFPVAICQNTTASLALSTPTSNPAVAACATGTNTQIGVAQFADGANALSLQGHFSLPADWTGNIDVKGKWRTSATSGDVVWQVATICVADAETVDPAFNAASTVTETAKGTTNQLNDFTIASVTVTGCAAGEELFFKVLRDPTNGSDTLAATAEIVGTLSFVIRRAM